MGYYIETPSNKNKAKYLMDNHRATRCSSSKDARVRKTKDTAIICVADNGPFEAAGICYRERELEAFTQPDDYRPKTWLLMPKSEVVKLNADVPLDW